jgi:hypothetical protein
MQKTSNIIWQDTQHQVLFELIDKIKEVPFDRNILIRGMSSLPSENDVYDVVAYIKDTAMTKFDILKSYV